MLGRGNPAEGSSGRLCLWQSKGHSETGGGQSDWEGSQIPVGVGWGLVMCHQEVLLPPTSGASS